MSDYQEQEKTRKKMRRQSVLGMLIAFFFMVYNGFIGIYYQQIFPFSIAIYYFFLLIITIIVGSRFKKGMTKNSIPLYIFTNVFLLALDVALLVPITLIVFFQKHTNLNALFVIGYAVYALFKIIRATVGYRKNKYNRNVAYLQLKTIKLIDAILSFLSLENIILIVCSSGDITTLLKWISFGSGIVIVILLIIITAKSMSRGLKMLKSVRN